MINHISFIPSQAGGGYFTQIEINKDWKIKSEQKN